MSRSHLVSFNLTDRQTWLNRNTETGFSCEAEPPQKCGQKKCIDLSGVIGKKVRGLVILVFSKRWNSVCSSLCLVWTSEEHTDVYSMRAL